MEFHAPPRRFLNGWNDAGIVVKPEELNIFKDYLRYHNIRSGYANFDTVIKRIRNAGVNVVFYRDRNSMHYYSTHSIPPRWMSNVRFSTLYEEVVDAEDFLELLHA